MNVILKWLMFISLIFFVLNYYVFGSDIAIWCFLEMISLLIILEKFFKYGKKIKGVLR